MTLIARAGMRRAATLEAKDFKAGAGQLIAQMDSKLAGGEIGEPPHLVNRCATRAVGDDDYQGFQRANTCFEATSPAPLEANHAGETRNVLRSCTPTSGVPRPATTTDQ